MTEATAGVQLKVRSKDLAEAIKACKAIMGRGAARPMFRHLHLVGHTLVATDGPNMVSVQLPTWGQDGEPMEQTVPIPVAITNAMPKGEVTFAVFHEDDGWLVTVGNASWTMPDTEGTILAPEFLRAYDPRTKQGTISGKSLAMILDLAKPAVADPNYARPLLAGLEFSPHHCTSTDGWGAALLDWPIHVGDSGECPITGVVEHHALHRMWRALPKRVQAADWTVFQTPQRVDLVAAGVHLSLPMMEGRFFAVRDLVPSSFPAWITLNRTAGEQLLEACQTIANVNDAPYAVTLKVQGGQLHVTAASVAAAQVSLDLPLLDHCDAEVTQRPESGPETRTGMMLTEFGVPFHAKKLGEMLARVLAGDLLVRIELVHTNAIARLRVNDHAAYVLMPLRSEDGWA